MAPSEEARMRHIDCVLKSATIDNGKAKEKALRPD